MLEHSQAKVKLYGSYLSKYFRVIFQDHHTSDIHLYDLFCGEGIYEGGGKGSPIIALDEIKKVYGSAEGQTPSTHITFNDINEKVISALNQNLKSVLLPDKCQTNISIGDYLTLLPDVKRKIETFKKEKAIVFLDPKGYKEIVISHIRELLSNDKVEVIVFLPIRDMYRFANMDAQEINVSHEALYKFIKEVFPSEIPTFKSPIDFINKVNVGLRKVLSGYYIDTFILEREKGQYFCLFFFTSHIRGFEKMLETKWELDEEQGRIWKYEKAGALFSEVEIDNLADKMIGFLSGSRKYNSDLFSFILHQGFLPKHANEILRDWQQNEILFVFEQGDKEARKSSFYLNYEAFKNTPQKVYYQLQPTLF